MNFPVPAAEFALVNFVRAEAKWQLKERVGSIDQVHRVPFLLALCTCAEGRVGGEGRKNWAQALGPRHLPLAKT